jgi:deoxyadenosine/deoxycytidine kinase
LIDLVRRGNKARMILAVAGNTGAGKSTLISLMSERLGQSWQVVPESVDDNPFLGPYGEDPARWALALQMHFLEKRRKALIDSRDLISEGGPIRGVILDRTLLEGAQIFVPQKLATGLLTTEEGKLHDRMLSTLGGVERFKPDVLIYLRRPAEVAHRQVMKRARSSDETVISKSFLSDLEKRYDRWFSDYISGPKYLWDAGSEDYLTQPALFEERFKDFCQLFLNAQGADRQGLRTADLSGLKLQRSQASSA